MTTHFCLGNPLDREAWQSAVHGAAERVTSEQLNNSNKVSMQTDGFLFCACRGSPALSAFP